MSTAAEKKRILAQKAASLNKHFKKTVIASADKVKNPYFMRRPTGIMELDLDLAGGFPPGVSFISGPEGAGKSHLLYRTMAMHQRLYGEKSAIALAAVEHPMDHFFMRKLGVIVAVPDESIEERNAWRKNHGLPGFTKEEVKELKRQVGTFWDITGATMEETLTTVIELLSDKTLREYDNQFGIIAIDSWNALTPKALLDIELDEHGQRGAHATCGTRFFAQYYPVSTSLDGDQMYTSLLFTQQVRANSAKSAAPSHIAKYLPDYVTTGAWAVKHGKLIDVLVTPGKKKKSENESGGKKETDVKMMCWETTKGKAGTHEGKTGEIAFEFGTEDYIDLQRTVYVSGLRHGILQESGGGSVVTLYTHDGVECPDVKNIPSLDFIQRMKDDVEFETRVRQEILAHEKIECRYA